MATGIAEGESFAYTTGVYGSRPTFLLTRRRVEDEHELTLYELAPEDIAAARQDRFVQAGSSVRVSTDQLANAIEGGTTPSDVSDDSTPYDWDGWCAIRIATLRGAHFSEVSTLVESVFRESGNEAATVCTGEPASVALPEGAGVRLSIVFRAMKPVRRRDRLRAIVRGVEKMSLGECYYWHAKCRSPTTASGAKALRELLAGHIN